MWASGVHRTMMLQGLIGLVAIPLIAWMLSERRNALSASDAAKLIGGCLLLQLALVIVLLQMPWTRAIFDGLGAAVLALQAATDAGARLVFGYLAGGPAPFDASAPQNGFIIAFRVLPMILVLSALVRLLYYWGIL
ncbi:MAG: Na+ dependent nucleoside transporter N-terminal domain-containing protein, partial [Pseudomonadota bacterium]